LGYLTDYLSALPDIFYEIGNLLFPLTLFAFILEVMRILEGKIPEKQTWRVCVMLSPDMLLGKMWQLASLLAKANNGELVAVVMVEDESEAQMTAGRDMVTRLNELLPDKQKSYTVIALARDYETGISEFAQEVEIDMLLARTDDANLRRLNHVNCTLVVVRGDADHPDQETPVPDKEELARILVPTAGGPNAIHALNMLLPMTNKSEITALYVALEHLGPNQEAHGRARLRQTTQFLGADDRLKTKLITAKTAMEGIVGEAANNYDLVVLGASRESSMDRILFGDVPGAVVRDSKKAVAIVREPRDRMTGVARKITWHLQHSLPHMSLAQRTDAYVRIRRGARADTGFYLLIACSAIIASFGLMLNSGAVVIGAMLVAPLMYPIVATGLAIVQGDPRFLKLALGTSLRGVALAIFVSVLIGFLNINDFLTTELMARTQPNLFDLGVAIFSGIAGAYALCHSDAAGALPGVAIAAALVPPLGTVGIAFSMGLYAESFGALLLFFTNFVAMSVATASVFLVLGFRPTLTKKDRRAIQARSVRAALVLLLVVSSILAYSTYRLAYDASAEARIQEVVRTQVEEVTGAELYDKQIDHFSRQRLEMHLTVLASESLSNSQVHDLQQRITTILSNDRVANEVHLTVTVIQVTRLEPQAAEPAQAAEP
jgi:uncharacterized hydrophobic protein (TIGR00271 family)